MYGCYCILAVASTVSVSVHPKCMKPHLDFSGIFSISVIMFFTVYSR